MKRFAKFSLIVLLLPASLLAAPGNRIDFAPRNATYYTSTSSTELANETVVSANVATMLGSADNSAIRSNIGLAIGTNVQAFDSDLTTWAGITPGSGVGTFLATPSSANLASAVTGETGSGALVFDTSPTLTTPNIGAATGTSIGLTGTITTTPTGGTGVLNHFETSESGVPDFALALERHAGENGATQNNNVLRLGYNLASGGGRQDSNDHSFHWVVESDYTTGASIRQLEHYYEYISPNGLFSSRPFSQTINIATNACETAIRPNTFTLGFPDTTYDWLHCDSFAASGQMRLNLNSNISFEAGNTATSFIVRAGAGLLGFTDAAQDSVDIARDFDLVTFFKAQSADDSTLTLRVGNSANRGSLRWNSSTDRWEFQANDASWSGIQPLDADLTSWAAITRASGFDTFTATPSSDNLASLVTGETGSGAAVFGTSPTLTTPNLGAATGTSLALGGATLGSNALAVTGTIYASAGMESDAWVTAGDASVIGWLDNRSAMSSPANGVIRLTNNAQNDFTRLQFGGTGATKPSLEVDGTELNVELADGSAYTTIKSHRKIVNDTDGATLAAADVGGQVYTNTGSAGSITFNLPAAVAGMHVTVIASAANAITINPDDSDKILVLTNATGDATSSDGSQGACVTLVAVDTTNWMVVSQIGTWADSN